MFNIHKKSKPDRVINIMTLAHELLSDDDRDVRLQNARSLALAINSHLSPSIIAPVHGEAGIPVWNEATGQLAGCKQLHPMEAWMLAEVVTAGTVSAHERATGEYISDDRMTLLAERLAVGALQRTGQLHQSIRWQQNL